MQFVRQHQSGEHGTAASRILNEPANARLCLLKPVTKAAYDARLKNDMSATTVPVDFQSFEFAETRFCTEAKTQSRRISRSGFGSAAPASS